MHRLLGISLAVFFISCGNSTKKSKEETGNSPQMILSETAEIAETETAFPVYDFDGLEPLLHKTDGKTYIVNFWATWCKLCVAELPDFERTYAEQKGNNVEMVLVSLDMPSMWEKRLVPFVKDNDLKGEVVILDDPKMNDWIPKLDSDWEGGIPATLIYNENKRTFYPHGFTYAELNTELEKFLN